MVSIPVCVFRTKSCVYPEDGGSNVLRSVTILPHNYMASLPRRPRPESSSPWKHPNLAKNLCWQN